jgi:hypothetical protein
LLGPFSLRGVDTGGFLANSNGQLGLSGEPTNRSAGWLIEPVGNSEPPEFVRLKSRATGDYLHVENPSPMVGPIEPGWWSAMWVMQKVGDGFTFRNRWKENHYLFGLPGRQPTVGPLQAGVSAARWALAATPPDNSALAAQPGAASAAPQVSVIVQNWSGAPLDIFLEVGPGDLGYVESLQANQEIALPSQPGMRWQLAQYEQWVGAFTATAQSQQIVPYGR